MRHFGKFTGRRIKVKDAKGKSHVVRSMGCMKLWTKDTSSLSLSLYLRVRESAVVAHVRGFNFGIFAFSLGTSSSKTPAVTGRALSAIISSAATVISKRIIGRDERVGFVIINTLRCHCLALLKEAAGRVFFSYHSPHPAK